MCTESTLVPMPEWAVAKAGEVDVSHPEYGVDEKGRPCFRIDACIVPALLAVWDAGFRTLGCCCGHGQGSGVISLDLGRTGQMGEHHCTKCGVLHSPARGIALGEGR